MAARYTTGAKWGEVSAQAQALAELFDRAAAECLRLADADATAYAAVGTARKAGDAQALAQAEAEAARIPLDLLALCAIHTEHLAGFAPRCNPNLLSDVKVGIHLLAGAGRAAWQTLLVNRPTKQVMDGARKLLAVLAQMEALVLTP